MAKNQLNIKKIERTIQSFSKVKFNLKNYKIVKNNALFIKCTCDTVSLKTKITLLFNNNKVNTVTDIKARVNSIYFEKSKN